MLYNQFVTRAKTIRVATSVGLGLALVGYLVCSADKFQNTELGTVQAVNEVEPPVGVAPIRIETAEPFRVGPRPIVIEDDFRFPPDIIHDQMWEDERKSVILAPPQGE